MSSPNDQVAPSGRDETPQERSDRNLSELLVELRVALPGVQVLFAFLLIVPFNPRFADVSPFQEKLYFATLLCTATATVLLIAPTVHHRIVFRLHEKERIVRSANRLALAGLGLLALAMTGAIVLVTDVLFGTATTLVTAAFVLALFALGWYAAPLRHRRQVLARVRRVEEEDSSSGR